MWNELLAGLAPLALLRLGVRWGAGGGQWGVATQACPTPLVPKVAAVSRVCSPDHQCRFHLLLNSMLQVAGMSVTKCFLHVRER